MTYFISDSTYGFVYSYTEYYKNLPYLIYYLSPSYVSTYILLEIHKKHLSQEQLIGISCGSAAIFFLMLTIIFLIIEKKQRLKNIDYDFSILSEEEINKLNEIEKIDEISSKCEDSSYDIDFWL